MGVSAPKRPPGIPAAAFWDPEVGRWELSERDGGGARAGDCLFFRADGSPLSRYRFAAGVEEGPFAIFHPDGRIAREGAFSAGRLEGIVTAHASELPGAEPLRTCCVPPKAARLEGRYEGGALLKELFFDADGRPIRSDGSPWPPRPAAVPADAEFEEWSARWIRHRPELERVWTADGQLAEETEYEAGARRLVRTFSPDGRIRQVCALSPDGRKHGAFSRRFDADAPRPYVDDRICQEEGRFELGRPVGDWIFRDGAGAVVRTARLGPALADELARTSPAFADGQAAITRDWWALCRDLRAEGRLREALAAAARGAARDGDAAALRSLLAAEVVALRPEVATQRGEALLQATQATVASILDELVTGADAASVLRALAAVVPGASEAALDFVAASLLLAPGRRMTHLTRALIRFQHGDEAGARQDTELVASEAFEAAASLRTYLDTVFRPFDFWPAHETLEPDPSLADVPLGIERDLDEIRQTLAIYAARVARLREAVRSLVDAAAAPVWLPPDTTPLCPEGFPSLERKWIASDGEGQEAGPSVADAAGDGSIEVDEEIASEGAGAPTLLAAAQAEWAALSWLCWAVGLDRVAVPDAVRPRELLAVAMKLIVTRCWRVQDRLRTGGLLAHTNDVPGFAWQGFEVDALPPHLVRAAAEEYISVRSMFFWLTSAEIASPFQTDLRKV